MYSYHNLIYTLSKSLKLSLTQDNGHTLKLHAVKTEHHTVVCLAEFVRSVRIGLSDFERGDLLNS